MTDLPVTLLFLYLHGLSGEGHASPLNPQFWAGARYGDLRSQKPYHLRASNHEDKVLRYNLNNNVIFLQTQEDKAVQPRNPKIPLFSFDCILNPLQNLIHTQTVTKSRSSKYELIWTRISISHQISSCSPHQMVKVACANLLPLLSPIILSQHKRNT
jgi:hypothetical protein